LKNVFIIDTTPMAESGVNKLEKAFFNPVIINYSENVSVFNEGCLSIPGINEDVLRPERIEVCFMDENFNEHEEILDGMIARIFQHEFDHLLGILFIDKISPLRKKIIKSKLRELKKLHNNFKN